MEADLKAQVEAEKAEKLALAASQKKSLASAEGQTKELADLSSAHEEAKQQLESSIEERKTLLAQGSEELKSSYAKVKQLTKDIDDEKNFAGELKNKVKASEIAH